MYVTVIVLFFTLGACLGRDVGPSILHTIEDGGLHGTIKYTNNDSSTPVFTFLSIPYASPPTGDLRFKPPVDVEPWGGIRDAANMPPECPQDRSFWKFDEVFGLYDLIEKAPMSEDCLFLNVYTPTLNAKAKLPVMVFIHGGALAIGSVWMTNGVATASYGQVVSIVINYRLGPFGFLSTFNEDAPGNVGFLDQVMALEWVQKNIASFGGDPDQVLIYGESAGSWSVMGHVVSPLSEGLFKRVIAQSGALSYSQIVHQKEDLEASMAKFVKTAGCDAESTSEEIACLRSKPAMDLVSQMTLDDLMAFGATYGYADTFFPESPTALLARPELKERLANLDIMAGVTENEGISTMLFMFNDLKANKTMEAWMSDVGMAYRFFYDKTVTDEMWNKYLGPALKAQYLPMRDPTYKDMILAASKGVSASTNIVVATIKTLKTLTENGANSYGYEVGLGPSKARSTRDDYLLCDHGEDLMFMSGISMMQGDELTFNVKFDEEDFEMERLMFNYWLNFAKTGNPNGPNLPTWPNYDTAESKVLIIKPGPEVEANFQEDNLKFWLETIPELTEKARKETQKDEL